MKHTFGWILVAMAVLPLACDDGAPSPLLGPDLGPGTGSSASSVESCNPTHVSRSGVTITVSPTGSDDTGNLQCALDAAAPGDAVQLTSGDYYTAQVSVTGFRGKLQGTGTKRTVIRNLPDLKVTAQDLFTETPGIGHTFPSLFSFGESELIVSDLTIKIIGNEPTTGWSIFGLELRELALAILVFGRTGKVRVHDVLIEGQRAPNTLYGTNLINGIYVQGNFAGNPGALTGSFVVERSKFRDVADPMPFSVVDGFKAIFRHNDIQGAVAVSSADLSNTSVEYAHNRVQSELGFYLFNFGVLPFGVQASDIVIRNNRLSGGYGALFEATFGSQVQCLLLGNNTRDTQNGLVLGLGTSVCKVVGGRARHSNGNEHAAAVGKARTPGKMRHP